MITQNSFIPKLWSLLRGGYTRESFVKNMLSGLTVAIVALPLAMALSIASGASPDKGLITAIVAGILVSLLGGSRVQIGGPTGAFVVVVFNVIATHGYDGLVLATAMAGVVLVVAGYFQLGQVIKFIPHPVITGFTAGIAVIIASCQVKDFLGLVMPQVPSDFVSKWAAYLSALPTMRGASVLVGATCLGLIIVLKHVAPRWPAYLSVVCVGALGVSIFSLPVETIGTHFPHILSSLPAPQMPVFSFLKMKEMLPSALTIAFLAGIEALLSATVADGMTGFKHRPNQELVAQGIANVASALFGGLPATGAIARTVTNIKAGARTPMSGVWHAVFLLIFMMWGTSFIKLIPMASLAAILFSVAWNMSERHQFMHIFKVSSSDRVVLVLTFLLTVLVDLSVAIGVGVCAACLLFIGQMSKATQISSVRKQDLCTHDPSQRANLPEGVEVFHVGGPLFFGVAGDLLETFNAMGQRPHVLILRMRQVPYLDVSGASVFMTLLHECRAQNIHVILSSLQPQPRQVLGRVGLKEEGEGVEMSASFKEAIEQARRYLKAS